MNKLITLIKINFLSAINTSTKRQSKLNKLLFGFIILFLLGISSFYAYSFVISLKEANITNFNFLIGFSVLASNFVLLFLFLSSCTNVLYKGQDNDLLFSMPIKKSTIILSKLISILLLGYIYQFVFIVPFAVLYYIYSGINFVSISCFLLGFFIQPRCCVNNLLYSVVLCKLHFKKIKAQKHFSYNFTICLFWGFFVFLYADRLIFVNAKRKRQFVCKILSLDKLVLSVYHKKQLAFFAIQFYSVGLLNKFNLSICLQNLF